MKNLFAILFMLLMLTAIGLAGYLVFRFAGTQLASLEPQVAIVLITTAITLLSIAIFIASAIRWAKRQDGLYRRQAERAAVYADLVRVWAEYLRQPPTDERSNQTKKQALVELEPFLVLWGSQRVLSEYAALQQLAQQTGAQNQVLASQFKKMLREMRKDLGNFDGGRNQDQFLELLLTPQPAGRQAATRQNHRETFVPAQ